LIFSLDEGVGVKVVRLEGEIDFEGFRRVARAAGGKRPDGGGNPFRDGRL